MQDDEKNEAATVETSPVADPQVAAAEAAVPVAEVAAPAPEAAVPAAKAAAPPAEAPRNPNMKWYIIHSYSGFERKVKESLESRVAEIGRAHV